MKRSFQSLCFNLPNQPFNSLLNFFPPPHFPKLFQFHQSDYLHGIPTFFSPSPLQGYYFCEAVAMRNRRPPVNQMLRLDILKALQQHPMDLHKVSQMVKRDGPITYQLLRLVNSPAWGMRQNVESIEVALVAVGENAFRRIATVAIASEFNGDQPAELLCLAMTRGRICELMSPKQGLEKRGLDPFGQYLLGLLQLACPAMQGQPMTEVVRTLPLADEILQALLGKKNPERVTLGWLEFYERGDWAGCDAVDRDRPEKLDQRELAKALR